MQTTAVIFHTKIKSTAVSTANGVAGRACASIAVVIFKSTIVALEVVALATLNQGFAAIHIFAGAAEGHFLTIFAPPNVASTAPLDLSASFFMIATNHIATSRTETELSFFADHFILAIFRKIFKHIR